MSAPFNVEVKRNAVWAVASRELHADRHWRGSAHKYFARMAIQSRATQIKITAGS